MADQKIFQLGVWGLLLESTEVVTYNICLKQCGWASSDRKLALSFSKVKYSMEATGSRVGSCFLRHTREQAFALAGRVPSGLGTQTLQLTWPWTLASSLLISQTDKWKAHWSAELVSGAPDDCTFHGPCIKWKYFFWLSCMQLTRDKSQANRVTQFYVGQLPSWEPTIFIAPCLHLNLRTNL